MKTTSTRVQMAIMGLVGTLAAGLLFVRFLAPRPSLLREKEASTAAATAPPSFQHSAEPLRSALIKVVQSQLSAFRNDDYLKAYSFASAGIKSQFPLKAFESMVKNQYPAIAQAAGASFGATLDNGTQAVVNVRVEADSKQTQQFRYLLIKEGEDWKVQGVVPIGPEGTAI